jgi:dynein heavy chain
VESEYFTVSATGVMRIRHGIQSEFTSLAEWVREKTLFDLISNIDFFKNYLTGRSFRRWHKVGLRRAWSKSGISSGDGFSFTWQLGTR